MKITKEQISNGIWILAIVLVLFTPLGFYPRVWVNKIVATVLSPSTVDKDEQANLKNYNWDLIDLEGKQTNLQSRKGVLPVSQNFQVLPISIKIMEIR